jgi:alpha-tubulin suppressor-like RCC1 family protein
LNDNQNRDEPTRVGTWTDWVAVAAEVAHTLGIKSDRSLWAWGWNQYGQLGLNDNHDRWVPTRVGNWSDWVMVAGGHEYTLGIRGDGSLWAWGDNSSGQLGLNDTQDRWLPTRVYLPNTMIWLPVILKQ